MSNNEKKISKIQIHINLLGLPVRDKVTEFEGVVSSIGFDLYGCIQAVVTPKVGAPDKECRWFDVTRLIVIGERVMPVPEYEKGYIAEGKKGPAEKPVIKE